MSSIIHFHDFMLQQAKVSDYSTGLACSTDDDHVSSNDVGTAPFNWDMALSLTSAIFLAFVAFLILSDKRLQAHPNMLIAYTCLADSYNFFNFFIRYVTCGYSLNRYLDYLFAATVQYPIAILFC